MRVIIAGSREIIDYGIVMDSIFNSGFINSLSEIVSGGARGVDRLGEKCAQELGIPVKVFKADWDRYGKGAGHIRNEQMANYANALIAVWDGKSKGTKNMIDCAKRLGLKVHIERVNV